MKLKKRSKWTKHTRIISSSTNVRDLFNCLFFFVNFNNGLLRFWWNKKKHTHTQEQKQKLVIRFIKNWVLESEFLCAKWTWFNEWFATFLKIFVHTRSAKKTLEKALGNNCRKNPLKNWEKNRKAWNLMEEKNERFS